MLKGFKVEYFILFYFVTSKFIREVGDLKSICFNYRIVKFVLAFFLELKYRYIFLDEKPELYSIVIKD